MSYNFEPLLSVIVPIYNTEDYLERCLNSIINQSYKNLEIILVNDGSTDSSKSICETYKKMDSRIKVINKKNGGLSSARNEGIRLSSGLLITFVDSDDWVNTDIYIKCVRAFINEKCDVVDFKVVYASSEINKIYEDNSEYTVRTGEDIIHDYLYRGQTEKCPFSVCRKVYRKDLFDNIKFPVGKMNEDISTNFKILEKCSKSVNLSSIGYYYFQDNNSSLTSGELTKQNFDLIHSSKELVELSQKYEDENIKSLAKIKLARSYFSLIAKAAIGGVDGDIDKNDMRYLVKELRRNYFLLMKSPIPLNRKIMISVACINYRIISFFYEIFTALLNIIK